MKYLCSPLIEKRAGAVLNESMNGACVALANRAIGSVPFLLKQGENAVIYKDGCIDDLFKTVKWILDHNDERKATAKKHMTP